MPPVASKYESVKPGRLSRPPAAAWRSRRCGAAEPNGFRTCGRIPILSKLRQRQGTLWMSFWRKPHGPWVPASENRPFDFDAAERKKFTFVAVARDRNIIRPQTQSCQSTKSGSGKERRSEATRR